MECRLIQKQNETIGPIMAPLATACVFGFNIAVSALIRPSAGFNGAVMNPARCIGPAISLYNVDNVWIWLFPPILASALHGVLYILVPPYHTNLYGKLDILT